MAIVEVAKQGNNPGIALAPHDTLLLIRTKDIDSFPTHDSDGVVYQGDIVLKEDVKPIELYMTRDTYEITEAPEGETDGVGTKATLKAKHPGNTEDYRKFKNQALNEEFIVLARYCGKNEMDMLGTPCNPCRFSNNYTGNNSGNSNEFELMQSMPGNGIAIYKGQLPI